VLEPPGPHESSHGRGELRRHEHAVEVQDHGRERHRTALGEGPGGNGSTAPLDNGHSERPWDRRLRGVTLQLCSVPVLKIYFAGPLFTPYERSFIDECAAALRADGFEVFVPHEHELATGVDVTAAWIFAKDRPGIERADAMLAILDGPSVDDGTACEIGMFHALMQSDPSKKGIVGLLTDIRGTRGESTGVNLFVQGAIEDVGRIVASIEEARDVLRAWR
jgi:Nucleoside 2-deoxyribosyltransferase